MNRIQPIYKAAPRILTALALALILVVGPAGAQAVDASLVLTRPSPGVAHDLDFLRLSDDPQVALYASGQVRAMSAQAASRVRDAGYSWEIFLLGLQVPFRTVDDRELGKGISRDIDLLILPNAEALSGRQRREILKYVDRGGSVIASGDVGSYDERGRSVTDPFFNNLFGAEYVRRVPEQPYGLLHTIDGASPVGAGVPPGFRLNIAAQTPLTAAKAVDGRSLGRMYSYSGRDDAAIADMSLMILNHHGNGAAMWMRFGPQDISRERSQQAAYQRMIVNAMSVLADARSVSVESWPFAARSALSIVTLPTVGFDPLAYIAGWDDTLEMLNSLQVPATHFVTTGEAQAFPDLVAAMNTYGEIAIAAENDDVLLGQSLEVQAGRLAASRAALRFTGAPGIYPPGGFFDGNTLRAAVEGGFSYVLLTGRESLSPSIIRWWEDVDYRALQAVASEEIDLAFLRTSSTRRRRRQEAPARVQAPEPSPAIVMPLDNGTMNYGERFAQVETAGGLFVLPFYPESNRSGSNRFIQMRDVLASAAERGAWLTTLSDAAAWWASRSGVAVDLVDSGRETFSFDVTNGGANTLEGLTLSLRLGDVGFDAIDAEGLDAELLRGDTAGMYLLIIDRLPPGTSRFTLDLF